MHRSYHFRGEIMKRLPLGAYLRPITLALLLLGLLAFGANQAAWATPAQSPARQTVPTRTPGAAPTAVAPTPTAQASASGPIVCDVRPADPATNAPRVIRQALDAASALTLTNCPWSIDIDAGDIGQPGALEIKLLAAGGSQPPSAGERFFGPHVELALFDQNGNPIARPSFQQPITLCFTYSADDLGLIGDPTAFAIELFNPDTKLWERLPSTLDRANRRVCTQLPHLSMYALAARVPQPAALPNTGAADTPAPLAVLWALLALTLGAGAHVWARRMQHRLASATQAAGGSRQ
jgi:hypothetical protein